MKHYPICFLSLMASFLTGCPSQNPTFIVSTTADSRDADLTDGLCQDTDGQCSLRAAVEQGNVLEGATIRLEPGQIYQMTSGELKVTGHVRLWGASDDAGNSLASLDYPVIIPSANARLFSVGDGVSFAQLEVVGLTFRGAHMPSGGGGVRSGGIAAIAKGSVFEGNSINVLDNVAEYAAAFRNAGSLKISDANISGNHCNGELMVEGGAIKNEGTLELESVALTDNTCDVGAAIASVGGSVSLRRVTIANNQAHLRAAAILSRAADLRIHQSTIAENAQQALPRRASISGVRGPAIDFSGAGRQFAAPAHNPSPQTGQAVFAAGACTNCHFTVDEGPGDPLSFALITPNKYEPSALAAKIYFDMSGYFPRELCASDEEKTRCALDVAAYLLESGSVPGTFIKYQAAPQMLLENSIVALNWGQGNCAIQGVMSQESIGNLIESTSGSTCIAALPPGNTLEDWRVVDDWTFSYFDPQSEATVPTSCEGQPVGLGYTPACWEDFTFGTRAVTARCENAAGEPCAQSAGAFVD